MKEEIINQGAAGCIYKYGVDCRGIKLNDKYVTKIQRNEKLSSNEAIIGKKIKEIPHYKDYFAPVIECCQVNLAKYDSEEVNKCEFIQKNKDKKRTYKMCKIPYVGQDTLGDHIYNVFRYTPMQFVKSLANTYLYVLKSLKILSDKNIVHYDLKENNVVCNSANTPIIIDFGRSIDLVETKTDVNKYKDIFFLYEPDFDYWCLDINFLMYMFNEIGDNWKTVIVTEEIVKGILHDFFSQTPIAIQLQKLYPAYKERQTVYFMNFVGKRWLEVFEELIKYIKTWDNYAMAVTYFIMITDFAEIKTKNGEYSILKKFNELLTSIITATPEERPTVEIVIEQSLIIFTEKLDRKSFYEMNNGVKTISKNEEKKKKIIAHFHKSKIAELRKEEELNALY
jgi:serine/threonine protein kinase